MSTTTLLVTNSNLVEVLLSAALRHAGFETREIATADQAAAVLDAPGGHESVLVLEAGVLEEKCASPGWGSFLRQRRSLPAVVVSLGEAAASVREDCRGTRRILLENPFDAATVVSAAQRVSAKAATGAPRPRSAADTSRRGDRT